MKILVTGAAGFIGFFVSKKLLEGGHSVYGIDNLNGYYDISLKEERLGLLKKLPNFSFQCLDIADRTGVSHVFRDNQFDFVVHLAAQAGVRFSLENPYAYGDANLSGFLNILEGCRQTKVGHLIFASSSSVYGANKKIPFSTEDNVDYPISLYAATKKANELMAHTYSHLYKIPTTGLRFFTVYGPMGRPDMAYFKFVKAIDEGDTIDVYNHGSMTRDFTYIDDIVEGIQRVIDAVPFEGCNKETSAPYRVFNIGNNDPVSLSSFIETIEDAMGKKAKKNMLPMQPGDVPLTYADISPLSELTGFSPKTSLKDGIFKFVDWYRNYYG